jgi:hypothetical protein
MVSSVAAEIANNNSPALLSGHGGAAGLFWRRSPIVTGHRGFIAKLEGAVSDLLSAKPSPIKKIASAD